jgi:HAMP domain-containing protein
VESQPQLPEPPSLDFDSLDTSSLIDQFCKYYTKLMDYRVGQIELKLKAETTDLQKRLSETVTELESTKSSLRKVKEIAKTRVTQLATEVAELTERLNKEKQLEEEIIAERDEYKPTQFHPAVRCLSLPFPVRYPTFPQQNLHANLSPGPSPCMLSGNSVSWSS